MKPEPTSYEAALELIEQQLPELHKTLKAADTARTQRLAQFASGARLRGANELLGHLRLLARSMAEQGHYNDLGFLVDRAIADFEIAIEGALSGMVCLAHDAMRDVMEIEFLCREFAADPPQHDRWLHASPKEIKDAFSPNALRQRHATRQKVDVKDLSEHADYKGHSMSLHVTPTRNRMLKKGIVDESDVLFGPDMAFWEVFFHARRLVFVLHELLKQPRFSNVENPDPQSELPHVASAFERTQEMQTMFFAFIKASSSSQDDDDA